MNRKTSISLFAMVTLGLGIRLSSGQTPTKTPRRDFTRPEPELENLPLKDSPQWSWTLRPWTGDDKPFVQIRQEVKEALDKEEDKLALVKKYQAEYADKEDAPSLFRWAYAAWVTEIPGQDKSQRMRYRIEPLQALRQVTLPDTYQYARLRFLYEMWNFKVPQLKYLGARLLKRNPDDFTVKFFFLRFLDPNKSAAERQQAISLANELVKENPTNAGAYTALADVYFSLWFDGGDKKAGKQAVAAYRKYLEVAPKDDYFRPQAQKIIDAIEKGIPPQ